ncbi:TetR/AcrR family transcriptional regulator [Streptomyces sp. 6N223]|uniref:TetR/AcrR family transcriptional regulator n=1 Tax=Streptomyces sp. 6N223 TaxID=3457412 RepID=UPI003FCFA86F
MSSATPTEPTSSAFAAAEADLGLRERKKLRTRQAIRQAAHRLIDERGYENTTIEQIAAAAEVSPSTVFRYFPSKEDIILTEDYAAPSIGFLLARPPDEPPLVALREAVIGVARLLHEECSAEFARRLELVSKVPALRAHVHEAHDRMVEDLSAALAERTGRPADDLELRVVVGAVMGALTQAVYDWGRHGQRSDLMATFERALAVLERGLTL